MITKDEASDLKSLTDRVIQCALELQNAEYAKRVADGNLASFVWRLSHAAVTAESK